jgi:hypothetical protein
MAAKLGVGCGRGGEAAGGRCKRVSEGGATVTFAMVFRLACAMTCKRDGDQMMRATRQTHHMSHVTS